MKKHLILHTALFLIVSSGFAQTYATPELKEQTEKNIAEKNARLKIEDPSFKAGDRKDTLISNIIPRPIGSNPLPDFTDYLRLLKVEAVKIDSSATKEQRDKYKAEAQGEFAAYDAKVSLKTRKLFFIPRKEVSYFKEFDFTIVGQFLKIDCQTCKILDFEIIESSIDNLIIETPNQDEEDAFYFRFYFIK